IQVEELKPWKKKKLKNHSFGADQFNDEHPGERIKKMPFFNWWNFSLCFGLLLGITVMVNVQDHQGWVTVDVILTAMVAASIVIFCIGHKPALESFGDEMMMVRRQRQSWRRWWWRFGGVRA
ncbi:hypothetical protein U1Q18_029662, partial [Sarracenia purpurea var. burkii]